MSAYPQPTAQPQPLAWEPENDADVVPPSRWEGSVTSFFARCRWDQDAGWRARARAHGDHLLLANIAGELGAHRPLSSITEEELATVVDATEERLDGKWLLDGDESTPMLERLDAHFEPATRQWLAEQERLARVREDQDRVLAAEQLNVLRREIMAGRAILEDTQTRLAAFEQQLEAEAAAQGVKAWP
jgi:hypothetical protein